jgi:RimJ/RimL family protein N-acetyltransferase
MSKCERIEVISPFPFEALPRVWRWIEPFKAKVADDFSPQDLEGFLAHMAHKWDRQKTWAVQGDGELGGLIIFEGLSPWLGTAHYLLKPDFQGRGIGVKALRLAVMEMFQEPGIGKLEFRVLAGNLAIGSLACNIGAKREGTLAGHTLSGGKPRDVWLYGLAKEDFEGKCNVLSAEQHHEADLIEHG